MNYCGSPLSCINTCSALTTCKEYRSELEFIGELRKCFHEKQSRVRTCICDKSGGVCQDLPFCQGAGRGVFDLVVSINIRYYFEVELKLNISSPERILKVIDECVSKFNRSCCDYVEAKRIIVFRSEELAKRARNLLKRARTSYRINVSSLKNLCEDLKRIIT